MPVPTPSSRPRSSKVRRSPVALLVVVALCMGCSQTVLIRTDRPGALLTVDGEDKGPIPEEGLYVAIPPGGQDVDYTLTEEGSVVERGVMEREVRWLPVVTALLATGLFVPFCALTCFTAANPLSCVAPIWLLAGTAAGVSGVLTSPGWLSLPFAFIGTAVGLTPMGLLCFSERTAPVLRVGVTEAGRRAREQTDADLAAPDATEAQPAERPPPTGAPSPDGEGAPAPPTADRRAGHPRDLVARMAF